MTKKIIPVKNYIITFGVVILIICGCLAFYNLYGIYQENKISVSPLSSKQILYVDLKNATEDIDADTFLLISYVEDKIVHDNEVEIKKYLNKRNLINNVIYLNATEYLHDENFITEINQTLNLNNKNKIEVLPALIYYRDGSVAHTIDSKDHIINKGDFEHIVDMYELAS